jgi:hypothetical protein
MRMFPEDGGTSLVVLHWRLRIHAFYGTDEG